VVGASYATLEDRPEALNRIGLNCANDMLADGVVYRLMRKAMLQPHIAGVSIGAEKAHAVRYRFSHESLKRVSICALDNASDHVSLTLNSANDCRLAGNDRWRAAIGSKILPP
jgi:hypothetical protein